ncbi:MAG: sulfur carrier protein ThiS adenylyltransferase ThiF [Candidatus Saccharicenans sp.]|jgi:sulfur carrier protein ThiS adenylyltransferase|nr:sulfur carrier protein ThiS adenylyltransferase ThiF [Candidatus Saccharicenans sp.]MDH7575075.1 sulfur carrier protein ThiS adenylyltransferase ThiF [Candidatus Saccharicenans sp.]
MKKTGSKKEKIDLAKLKKEFFSRHDPELLPVLRKAVVGIAGAGGLGSNVAASLARAGVGKLIIADLDRVYPSNLNRQQYFVDQIGRPKVEALRENLKRMNPFSEYEIHETRITPRNIKKLFGEAEILVEAFDLATEKSMLINTWLSLFPDRPIVAASGLSGFGKNHKIRTRKMGQLYLCGDEESEPTETVSPMAPRVGIVANMQANLVIELLWTRHRSGRKSG